MPVNLRLIYYSYLVKQQRTKDKQAIKYISNILHSLNVYSLNTSQLKGLHGDIINILIKELLLVI